MKRIRKIMCCALLAALLLSCAARAEISFEGRVVAGETATVLAPFGGMVDKIALRTGDRVDVGDDVATITTTKVYATADGTVSGVFAREGDDAASIAERYGALVYIEPTNRYVISASTEKAYNSSATKYIHIGEKVHLSCTKDGSHTGTAIVTSVSEADEAGNTPYKLEVVGGSFYMGETVGIFRSAGYDSNTRIGRGTIQQNAAIAVKGSGSVLKLHVQEGDCVERGELLFETVEGALDGLYAMDNTIVSGVAGVVASVDVAPGGSVSKGAKLIGVYPDGSLQIEILVSEMDLRELREGAQVEIEFDWDAEGLCRAKGVVDSISHVNATAQEGASASGAAEYSAYISFDAAQDVRLGMSAIVYLSGDEELDGELDAEMDEMIDAEETIGWEAEA